MSSVNSLSSARAQTGNWEISPMRRLGKTKLKEDTLPTTSLNNTPPLFATFGKIKNYFERLALALIGTEKTNKTSVQGEIEPEKEEETYADDPVIGNWPSSFPNTFSPAPQNFLKTNKIPNPTEESFNEVMAQAEEQKSALEMLKNEVGESAFL